MCEHIALHIIGCSFCVSMLFSRLLQRQGGLSWPGPLRILYIDICIMMADEDLDCM
jgi:hypothetical protein